MRRASSEQFTAADAEQTPAQRPRRAARPEGIRVRIRRWFIPVVGFIAIVLCIRNYAAIAAFGEEVRLWEDQVCTRARLLSSGSRGNHHPCSRYPGRGSVRIRIVTWACVV
jgi:hypothetical protein